MVYNAAQPLPQRGGTEIDEQSNGQMEQAEIGQQLLLVNRRNCLHRFQLHDNRSLHKQIDPESFLELKTVELEGV